MRHLLSLSRFRGSGQQGSGILIPKDPLQAAKVHQIICIAEDIYCTVNACVCASEDQAAEKLANLIKFADVWIPNLETLIRANGKNGYAVGDSLTYADIQIYCLHKCMHAVPFDVGPVLSKLATSKSIMAVVKIVTDNKKVQSYEAKFK
eukprot:GHVN01033777.1.p1 GENE.GHVN01033777.1~~GHVN01033777.1.p1  ORF type:complete len:149 (+),score=8.42 GHVN01033777.1:189-635(+)